MPLSLRAYAKHRGVSLAAVQKAIKSGRVKTLPDGKVDPELADAQWKARTLASRQKRPPASDASGGAAGKTRTDAARSVSDSDDADAAPEVDDGDYYEAQRQHEWEKVRKERLSRRVREGELLEAREVIEQIGNMIVSAKTNLRGIGAKLAPELAAEGNAAICQSLLDAEIDKALSLISKWTPSTMKRT